jgi:hypothetical protein
MLTHIVRKLGKPARVATLVPLAAALILTAAPTPGSAASRAANNQPDATCPAGGQCFADVLPDNPFYDFANRIYMEDLVTGYPCGGAGEPCDSENRPYYRPGAQVNRGQMAKFIDNARHLAQIKIEVPSGNPPIFVKNTADTALSVFSTNGQALQVQSQTQAAIYAQTGNTAAVSGFSTGGTSGMGIYGSGHIGVKGASSASGAAVLGDNSGAGAGVSGESGTGFGLVGASGTGTGMLGVAGSGGNAGNFIGNVSITGNVSKGGGSFKIDHPLDPTNKYLYHSFVESPDMMNIYNGNVTLDTKGEATVTMPEWFQALNQDFRYQLTAVGAPGPNLYIASKIESNTFKIAGGTPNSEVSWQVTGIRHDDYANAHRIPVEEEKAQNDKGTYLYPTEAGQPESQGESYTTIQQYAPQTGK